VQGFIAQSRRTADGWVGSYLLSYLSGRAISGALHAGVAPNQIVEPDLDDVWMFKAMDPTVSKVPGDTTVAALPNTVVLSVKDGSENATGGQMEAAAKDAWQEVTGAILSTLPASVFAPPVNNWSMTWTRQIKHHWEYYWAWGTDSADAFHALGARKGLRNFPPSDRTEEHGDRCTVCGQREALWNGKSKQPPARSALREQWMQWAEALNGKELSTGGPTPRTLLRPDGRERLCALCLIKRLIPWTDNPVSALWDKGNRTGEAAVFPSTSTMATVLHKVALVEKALEKTELYDALTQYLRTMRDTKLYSHADDVSSFDRWVSCWNKAPNSKRQSVREILELDGDWYLFGEAVLREHGVEDENTAKELSRAFRDLNDAALKAQIANPPIYWALLTMDGDNMGDLMEKLASKGCSGKASKLLNQFAREVDPIVCKHSGRTIYAGGDDVLAFLPLETALDAADELRGKFAELLSPIAATVSCTASLSGSLVFAHHQAPLSTVLGQGHAFLEEVKRTLAAEGKDGVGLLRYQRGGPAERVIARWDPFLERLQALITRLQAKDDADLSHGLPYTLREQAALFGDKGILKPGPAAALSPGEPSAEARYLARLIGKSRLLERYGSEEERDNRALQLAKDILEVCNCAASPDQQLNVEPLLMARFLAGGGREER
jgi:CRISPR-associated protein Cmr2